MTQSKVASRVRYIPQALSYLKVYSQLIVDSVGSWGSTTPNSLFVHAASTPEHFSSLLGLYIRLSQQDCIQFRHELATMITNSPR